MFRPGLDARVHGKTGRKVMWPSGAAIDVVEALDVVLAEIVAVLHFDQHHRLGGAVGQPVHGTWAI